MLEYQLQNLGKGTRCMQNFWGLFHESGDWRCNVYDSKRFDLDVPLKGLRQMPHGRVKLKAPGR
jgi:hypothetical protein